MAREILLYNKERVFAFVLALGEVDDLKYAAAAGAINFGFPVIADTVIPEILPTGVTTYEHVVSACRSTRSTARMTWSAPSGWCRSASKCAASRSKSPMCRCRSLRLGLRRRSGAQGRYARRVWRQALALLRIPAHGRAGRGRRTARSKSSVPTSTSMRAQGRMDWASSSKWPAARCRRTSSRCWSARSTTSSTALGHPAHRPARHRLDPHLQGRCRQGLQPGALRQDPARPLPRRLRRDRR